MFSTNQSLNKKETYYCPLCNSPLIVDEKIKLMKIQQPETKIPSRSSTQRNPNFSFLLSRRSRAVSSAPTLESSQLQFTQWFGSMIEKFGDFGIPCENCFNIMMLRYAQDEKQLENSIEAYQMATVHIFQSMTSVEHETVTIERELRDLQNEIIALDRTNKMLKRREEDMINYKNIIENHLNECYQIESELILLGYTSIEHLVNLKSWNSDITLPVQKKLTWLHLFNIEQIVPELSSFSIINFVKARPITPILGILMVQLKILANMISYQFTTVLVDPIEKQRKPNFPVLTTKDITLNNKKTNRFILQCFLDMLMELSQKIDEISKDRFFLIYQIQGEMINKIDFTNYDNRKWSEALNGFLSNTEHCYKWIVREFPNGYSNK